MKSSSFLPTYGCSIVMRGCNLPALLLIKQGWNLSAQKQGWNLPAFTSIFHSMMDRLSPPASDCRGFCNADDVTSWAGFNHKRRSYINRKLYINHRTWWRRGMNWIHNFVELLGWGSMPCQVIRSGDQVRWLRHCNCPPSRTQALTSM